LLDVVFDPDGEPEAETTTPGTGLDGDEAQKVTVPDISLPPTVSLPFEVVEQGLPSLNLKLVHIRSLEEPVEPTTLKRILMSVPEPDRGTVPNAERVNRPGVEVFGVMVIPLLRVPAVSNEGFCKIITDELKLSTKSNATTF
jgi:hypothetical protein